MIELILYNDRNEMVLVNPLTIAYIRYDNTWNCVNIVFAGDRAISVQDTLEHINYKIDQFYRTQYGI